MSTPFAKKIPGHPGALGGGFVARTPVEKPHQTILFCMKPAGLVNKGLQRMLILFRCNRNRHQCGFGISGTGPQPDKLL
jgi:hypothetical protein